MYGIKLVVLVGLKLLKQQTCRTIWDSKKKKHVATLFMNISDIKMNVCNIQKINVIANKT